MQQSNTYIIVYSAVLTIILGLLLSGSAQVLGPWQQEAIALDKKKQILGAVISAEEIAAMTPEQVNAFYSSRISSTVVDVTGKEITKEGVSAEKVEIAGLGARITEAKVQERYVGKKIFDESGALVTVMMQKGEGKKYDGDAHKVDGMSGATITGNGVNNMLKAYMGNYEAYIKAKSTPKAVVAAL